VTLLARRFRVRFQDRIDCNQWSQHWLLALSPPFRGLCIGLRLAHHPAAES